MLGNSRVTEHPVASQEGLRGVRCNSELCRQYEETNAIKEVEIGKMR
jgi:hypothetical protein